MRILFVNGIDSGIQQQGNIGLAGYLIQQDGIEYQWIAFGVAVSVLHQQLVHQPAFPCPAVVIAHVGSGAQYPQPHFTAGVTAQHRSVLHQCNFEALACCSNSAAHTGKTAAGDHEVNIYVFTGKRTLPGSFRLHHCLFFFS